MGVDPMLQSVITRDWRRLPAARFEGRRPTGPPDRSDTVRRAGGGLSVAERSDTDDALAVRAWSLRSSSAMQMGPIQAIPGARVANPAEF